MHSMHIFGIVYDNGNENAVNKPAKQLKISAVEETETELKVTAKSTDGKETLEYSFEKGLYDVKIFCLEMDVIDVHDLMGRSIIAYMDGNKILRITRDICH